MTTLSGLELTEIKKPTTTGTYYYLGAPNWSEPSKITVIERCRGELFVVFKEGLAGSALNSLWPYDAKWFQAA